MVVGEKLPFMGLGYFEWVAEGEGCTSVRLEFKTTVKRAYKVGSVEQFQDASNTLIHTLTINEIDDPPKLINQPPTAVGLEETNNGEYEFKFNVLDPEIRDNLASSCTAYSGSIFTSTISKDGSESKIVWKHDSADKDTSSGVVSCKVFQSSDSNKYPNYFLL